MHTRFVLDANLSPLTRQFLIDRFGFDVVDLVTLGVGHYDDLGVLLFAQQDARVIITLDLDFGGIFRSQPAGAVGVILLRLEHSTVEAVNSVLERFFESDIDHIELEESLVLIEEHRIRVRTS